MALLFMDGFDANDYAIKGWTPGSVVSTDTTTRFGVGRGLVLSATSRNVTRGIPFSGKAFVGMAIQTPASLAAFVPVTFSSDGGTVIHGNVRINANGSIDALRNTTVLASTAAGLIAASSWLYLEVSATIADSGGNIVVRVNGVEVLNFTGDTRNAGTSTQIDAVQIKGNAIYDDFYAADGVDGTTLSPPQDQPFNDFLGDVRVHTVVPTGAGNSTQLTPSTGANYAAVDELPWSATDYVSSATAGHKDTYATSDLPSGVSTVFAVQSNLIGKKTDAGARSVKTVVRSGGTDYAGATQALTAGDATVTEIRTTNPATSTAWTSSTVNAVEIGLEVV